MKYNIIILITGVLLSCNAPLQDSNSEMFYETTNLSKKEAILYKTFSLDTLKISDIETSYAGQFTVFNDTLYFIDERFAYLFLFDEDGIFIGQHIGRGAGPNEVLGMSGAVFSKNNFISYNDKNSSIDIFDKQFNKQKNFRMDWDVKRSYSEVFEKPIPSLGDSYEFDYGIPNIFKKWDEEYISMAITASHPKFNGYFDTDLYYNYARAFALVNIHTGKVEKLVGRRSPVYLSQKTSRILTTLIMIRTKIPMMFI